MRVKGIRIIQGKTASNDLKMSLGAVGHRQVQGSWALKFEAEQGLARPNPLQFLKLACKNA
jgi:hypothetical protein